MYSVWFSDCQKVIETLKNKCPNLLTFCSIEGNVFGDFIIKDETCTYLVKHSDFSVWYLNGDWKNGKWTEIK